MCFARLLPGDRCSTTRPRTSAQSHGSSPEWMSTVIPGSLRMFLARCRCGSVFTRTCSPSVSTQVSSACGWPSGIRRHHGGQVLSLGQPDDVRIKWHKGPEPSFRPPLESPFRPGGPSADSVTEYGNHHRPGEGVEAQVEAYHRGEMSESTPRESTSSACTANTYRCGGSPACGAAPPKSLEP